MGSVRNNKWNGVLIARFLHEKFGIVSRIHDIESYAVHSFLIIGKTPTEVDQQKSFELFRRNSKDVQIVTFDELLEKLRQLRSFLAEEDE
ncbi:Shedu anti-phage system protein SduA domain-containing protein [Candidatus Thiodictyon syntrophicum]|uniref:Shedu anti-phage system protein SduA domain-containing protein n=1 Tax=Candidatus Thiodictyon syntrophicum TaxID=1166950 RepID=UPI001C12A8DD